MSVLKFKGRRYDGKSNTDGIVSDSAKRVKDNYNSSKDSVLGLPNVRTDFYKQTPVLSKKRLSKTPLYIAIFGVLGGILGLGAYLKQSQSTSRSREALYQLSIQVEDLKSQPVAGAAIFKENKRLGQTNDKGYWTRSVKAISNSEMELRVVHDKSPQEPIENRLAIYFPKWSKNSAAVSKKVQLNFDQSAVKNAGELAAAASESTVIESGDATSASNLSNAAPSTSEDQISASAQKARSSEIKDEKNNPSISQLRNLDKKDDFSNKPADSFDKVQVKLASEKQLPLNKNQPAKSGVKSDNPVILEKNQVTHENPQPPSAAIAGKPIPSIVVPLKQTQGETSGENKANSSSQSASSKIESQGQNLLANNSDLINANGLVPIVEVRAINLSPASPYNNAQSTTELVEGMKLKLKTYGIKTEAGAPFLITLKNLSARTGDQDEDLIEVTTYSQGKLTGRLLRNYQKSIPFTVRSILWAVRLAYPSEYVVSKNKDIMTVSQPFSEGNIWNLFDGMQLADSKGSLATVSTIPGNSKTVKVSSSGQFCHNLSTCKVSFVKSVPRVAGWKKYSVLVKGMAGRKIDLYAAGIPCQKSGETHVYEGPSLGTTVLTAVEGEKIIYRTALTNQENRVNTVVLPMPAISKR